MGKFKPSKIKKRLEKEEKNKKRNIRKALRSKKLIRLIKRRSTGELKDGILLFGSNRGERVTRLLNSFDNSDYVLGYLSNSEDLPMKFKKTIRKIVENFDPFLTQGGNDLSPSEGLNVREIDPNDDIPW